MGKRARRRQLASVAWASAPMRRHACPGITFDRNANRALNGVARRTRLKFTGGASNSIRNRTDDQFGTRITGRNSSAAGGKPPPTAKKTNGAVLRTASSRLATYLTNDEFRPVAEAFYYRVHTLGPSCVVLGSRRRSQKKITHLFLRSDAALPPRTIRRSQPESVPAVERLESVPAVERRRRILARPFDPYLR
jgi:hypothetical protein